MAVLVQLGLLGVLWAGAGAALHPVDNPAAPEAECLASYIYSVLPPDNSCLVVHGDARLIGPLLQNLQDLDRGRLTLVMDPRDIPTHTRVRIESTTLAVIAAENPANLSTLAFRDVGLFSYSGLVVWVRARSLEDAMLRDQADQRQLLWMCSKGVFLFISTPNGTTVQFAPDLYGSCVVRQADLKLRETDRCEPGHRGWFGRRWPRLCSSWKSPEPGKTTPQLLAIMPSYSFGQQLSQSTDYQAPYYHFARSLATAVSRRLPIELTWIVPNSTIVLEYTANCSLAAALLSYGVNVKPMRDTEQDAIFMSPIVVVVPAGAGPRLNVLQAVTAEFSAELWIATALALLFMTAAMAVAWTTLGRPPLTALAVALLQTLAPLLAQSPPGRTAHRPLSAVWLLMSVVLAAAYQGLLL
ncbi:Ionotropic receptor 105, partial [Frankliniella occidentalis]